MLKQHWNFRRVRPSDLGQLGFIDPDCRIIGVRLTDGTLTVIPLNDGGELLEPCVFKCGILFLARKALVANDLLPWVLLNASLLRIVMPHVPYCVPSSSFVAFLDLTIRYDLKIDELQTLKIEFLHNCAEPTFAMIYQDYKYRHVKTWTVDSVNKTLKPGPWELSEVS